MSVADLAVVLFGWVGNHVSQLCGDLEAADIRMYPVAYGSLVVLATILSSVFSVGFSIWLISLNFASPFLLMGMILVPIIVFAAGVMWPRIKIASRSSALASEVPYAAAYTSVMATGGMSPYMSILRLSRAALLPTFSKMARILEVKVRGLGYDPVSALEELAKSMPSIEFKELLLGYAATLRAGGDVVHYLLRRTEVLFRERLSNLKTIADNVAQMMEIYMSVGVLLALGLYSIFAISFAMQSISSEIGQIGFFGSTGVFMVFSYIILPFLSYFFLWFVDTTQPKYPTEDNSPYLVFLGTAIPLIAILSAGFFFPFVLPELMKIEPLRMMSEITRQICRALNLEMGFASSIGLLITIIIATFPATIYTLYIELKERGMDSGLANFLRDLVEVRKSGLSPEKCILNLSNRNYGTLSKYVKVISKQLSWGVSFSKIYTDFSKRVRSWLPKVSVFLLLDTIEVGGGTPETLETLAQFNESIISMEKEKSRMLKPLLLVPYIGTITLVVVVVTLLTFFRSVLTITAQTLPFSEIVQLMVPPLVIHVYNMGLVGGKIATGKTSDGFVHALILLIFTFVCLALTPYYSVNLQFAPLPQR